MPKRFSRVKKGVSINPSESNRDMENKETKSKEDTKEGSFRNVERSVDKKNLDDEEGKRGEDQITEEKINQQKKYPEVDG